MNGVREFYRLSDLEDVPEPDLQMYHLTDVRTREQRRRDREGYPWTSLGKLLRDASRLEASSWTPEDEATESLLSEHNEGGGLYGADPAMHETKAGLLALGAEESG